VLKEPENIGPYDAVFDEGICSLDVRLVADVATTLLVSADSYVAYAWIIADVGIMKLEPLDACAPASAGRRQEVVEAFQVVVEIAATAQALDRLA